ncbi:MAG: DNRLRE domain-containing protein [Anaerolineae bacterium]|nr:DNRLRE domain-containing protein [Anaerolineae bacterium]
MSKTTLRILLAAIVLGLIGAPSGVAQGANAPGAAAQVGAVYVPLFLTPAIYPSLADADIYSGRPDENGAYYSDLWLGYDTVEQDYLAMRILYRFDLPADVDQASVRSARLRLYLVNSFDTDVSRICRIYRISSPWEEETVTWNTHPQLAEQHAAASVPDTGDVWISWDVTTLVRGWLQGAYPNYGLMLIGDETQLNIRVFASREDETYPPELVIEYTR